MPDLQSLPPRWARLDRSYRCAYRACGCRFDATALHQRSDHWNPEAWFAPCGHDQSAHAPYTYLSEGRGLDREEPTADWEGDGEPVARGYVGLARLSARCGASAGGLVVLVLGAMAVLALLGGMVAVLAAAFGSDPPGR